MGTIVRRPAGKKTGYVSAESTMAHRVKVLRAARDLYTESSIAKSRRKSSAPLEDLALVWESGLFSLAHMEELSGYTRKTLKKWLVGVGRVPVTLRGKIQIHHIEPLIQRMVYTMRVEDEDNTEFMQTLIDEGSAEYLIKPLLEDVSDDHPVRTEVRPDDEGHSEDSQGGSEAEHEDSSGVGSGEGEEEPEPVDVGEVREAAPRDSASESGAAQVKRLLTEYVGVDAEGREVVRDETGTEIVGDDWDPFADFTPDDSGDSFLESADEPQTGRGLPDLPSVGAPWDMADEEEEAEPGH